MCDTLSLNAYTDWFLPSKDEIYEMYLNKAAIDATAIVNGCTAFVSVAGIYYWSSSEYDELFAFIQSFEDGNFHEDAKASTNRVRVVRAF